MDSPLLEQWLRTPGVYFAITGICGIAHEWMTGRFRRIAHLPIRELYKVKGMYKNESPIAVMVERIGAVSFLAGMICLVKSIP